jgi:hypothetical protein
METNKKSVFKLTVGSKISLRHSDIDKSGVFVVSDFYGLESQLDNGKGIIRLRSLTCESEDIYISNVELIEP